MILVSHSQRGPGVRAVALVRFRRLELTSLLERRQRLQWVQERGAHPKELEARGTRQ